jgi:TonB family protein
MKTRTAALVLAALLGPLTALARDPQESVPTYARVLIGQTEPGAQKAEVLIVPGMVVLPGESAEQKAVDLLRVMDELKDSYRLDRLEVASSLFQPLSPGATVSVPSVTGGPTIAATLVGADDKKAVYRVTLKEGEKVLAEPVISVRRGGRAIVGSRDGTAAPYLFVLIEALSASPKPSAAGGAVREPKLVSKVPPQYPDEARRAKVQGLVIIEATIATDGTIKATRVLRGEPLGLSEAALAAVKQWRYEPVRDAKGAAVEATITVSINFKLG